MKFFSPDNIFTRLILKFLPADLKNEVIFLPSSIISKELSDNNSSLGFIPSMDLINHKDFFVSKSFGISFEGHLCNSYIYYKNEGKEISDVNLFGDISSLEVVIGKILFKELYGLEPAFHILTNEELIYQNNILVVGDKNFHENNLPSAVSFSEEITELLSLPFVNFVLASKEEKLVNSFNDYVNGTENKVYDYVETNGFENLSKESEQYIKENISSFVMNFDANDREGIEQLLRLPYFHGIIDNIIEVKFV